MKKSAKSKGPAASAQTGAELADLIVRVMQQLTFLDKKLDTLISQSRNTPVQPRSFPAPFQYPGRHEQHGQPRQDNNFSQRVLHKAVCADCSKECEVPFKPTGDRPVYCKVCFAKRKEGTAFKGGHDNRHAGPNRSEKKPFYKKFVDKDAAPSEKKRPGARRRKKSKA